ncbi:MAG: hypothetical protein JEZ08_17645 [Clostridiales bacterium]|nr:hypothetical protein [Clostridiales bacterium]
MKLKNKSVILRIVIMITLFSFSFSTIALAEGEDLPRLFAASCYSNTQVAEIEKILE